MNLRAEAARLGVQGEYIDALGRRRKVSRQALESIVRALRSGSARAVEVPDSRPIASPPRQAFQGPAGRWWLLAVQLYGVRSRHNWGHGDFSDLLALIELAAEVGAGGVGLNPLHALFDDLPDQPSPYSPNSRLLLNPLYVDLDAVPEFEGPSTAEMSSTIERLRQSELVDYVGISALKQRGLRAAHQAFLTDATSARREDFAKFRESRGMVLVRFAAFEVLRRRFKEPWWEWPPEWRTPDDVAIEQLRAETGDEIGFHEYTQWLADHQLMRCRDRAHELGLPVGLYIDVAVGVRADGFDAWNAPDAVTRALSLGAPPDALNTLGQNWALAGFSGVGLQAQGFAPYRDMLRASMRYAGAIRLDHVLGLKRLYLIPAGLRPDQGAYVRMPFEQLLDATAEESQARRCIVIGEDLGTVPRGFRAEVARHGIWSYQVMMFERDARGDFRPPEHFAERALVTFSTHDLPPFTGWLTQHDLGVRESLHIPAGETSDERDRAAAALQAALRRQGYSACDFASVAGYLAASPARLLAIGLEDVLDVHDQVNIPGTGDQHPNWRRKLPLELERIRDDPRLREIARIAAERGRSGRAKAALTTGAEQSETIAR
jgi:4-alpha-glucanotransferase